MPLEPGLLLLDEPASGLNARETIAMGELIGKIKDMNVTVWLVEHDMDLVMDISDHVAVINFGSLIAQGTPAEIQRNRGRYFGISGRVGKWRITTWELRMTN